MTSSSPQSPDNARPDRIENIVQDFLTEKRKDEADFAKRFPKPRRGVLAGFLTVLAAAVWIGPSFIGKPAPELPAAVEAGVRVRVFLAAQRVREFQQRTGRLPGSLDEARVNDPALGFAPAGSGDFEVFGEARGSRITFRSTMDGKEFLGAAIALLRVRT